MLGGIFVSSHACLAVQRINIAKNRTAGNTLFMRIASVTHVMMPLLWVALSWSLHMKALEFAAFVVRVWDLINPRVLRIERSLHVKCWTLPLLQFNHERMQLVYKVSWLDNILRNHLLSDNMQWNYASFNVSLTYLMEFWITSSLPLNNWEQKHCQTHGNKPNHSHCVLRGWLFSEGKI